ncbi:hypothetical protein [Thermomonospora umbrina]|uniref:Uncharacterized protein n=1 Tax=Thermomonospora umbrina TaxID=111806 RepID=A0A3D9SPW5_9ACTN|nr:hypothetical protein [Thermomonospora umbrina]REE96003.1 hypothetical protein DFJ69_1423 [Thermomonospora umbrina]
MRLYDEDGGRLVELPSGPLHIHVHEGDLRAHLTADLLRRVAGRYRRVRVTRSGPLPPGRPLADYNVLGMDEGDAASAHVHVGGAPSHENASRPPGDDDATAGVGERSSRRTGGLRLRPGPMPALDPSSADVDPVTVRLAILRVPYREPITTDPLADVQDLLDRWRTLVADWARSPGRPMSRDHVQKAEAALGDDLNTSAALATLQHLADDSTIASGAKFETFVHLDLLLALDLVRSL